MIKTIQNKIFILSKKYGQRIGLDLPYFVKNGFWVALRQGVGVISGLALSIAFARLASQEVFGQYQFILSILSIVSILSVPGLNTSIIQSAARGYDGDYKRVVKISFLWSLLGVPTLLILGGYYYIYQNHALGMALMISSIFFPFFYAPNTWDSFLQGKGRFDVSAKYSSMQAIINTIVTMGVIFFSGNNLVLIVTIYLVSYTFFNGYYYLKSLEYIENNKKDPEVVGYGWFLTKMNFIGIITNNIDRILVGILLGPVSLAAYSVISMIINKYKDIIKTFISIIIPKLSMNDRGIQKIISKHKFILAVFFVFYLFLAVCFYYLMPIINKFLFGSGYVQYYVLSKYYAIAFFFIVPVTFLGYYSQVNKRRVSILASGLFFQVFRIVINVLCILKLGLLGAVFAYNFLLLALFVLNYISILFEEFVKQESVPVRKN